MIRDQQNRASADLGLNFASEAQSPVPKNTLSPRPKDKLHLVFPEQNS